MWHHWLMCVEARSLDPGVCFELPLVQGEWKSRMNDCDCAIVELDPKIIQNSPGMRRSETYNH